MVVLGARQDGSNGLEVWTYEGLLWRCKEAGIEPAELLKRAGVHPNNLYYWARGRIPHVATMKKVMNAFPESARHPQSVPPPPSGGGQVEVWSLEELLGYCKEAGVKPITLLKRAGVTPTNLFYWRRGRLPEVGTMRRIMKAFRKEALRVRMAPKAWTFEELLSQCREAGIEVVELLERAGINPGSRYYWKRGGRPNMDSMNKILSAVTRKDAE